MNDADQNKVLYVLRHGQAESGFPDAERALTERGRADVKENLSGLSERLIRIDNLIASSLVRAQQTAAIAGEILAPELSIMTSEEIRPWSSPSTFLNDLDQMTGNTMIVSHQPFVGELIAYFADVDIHMQTSSIAALQYTEAERGCAELLWVESL